MAVAYYHASPVGHERGARDPAEAAEVGWFAWDELPADLAPPDRFPAVLEAWREAWLAADTVTPLRDRP